MSISAEIRGGEPNVTEPHPVGVTGARLIIADSLTPSERDIHHAATIARLRAQNDVASMEEVAALRTVDPVAKFVSGDTLHTRLTFPVFSEETVRQEQTWRRHVAVFLSGYHGLSEIRDISFPEQYRENFTDYESLIVHGRLIPSRTRQRQPVSVEYFFLKRLLVSPEVQKA